MSCFRRVIIKEQNNKSDEPEPKSPSTCFKWRFQRRGERINARMPSTNRSYFCDNDVIIALPVGSENKAVKLRKKVFDDSKLTIKFIVSYKQVQT